VFDDFGPCGQSISRQRLLKITPSALDEVMTTTPTAPQHAPQVNDAQLNPLARFIRATELDTRMLGMVAALLMIWIGFHLYGVLVNGNGVFLTPRNLWNLSVQTAVTGIMATGMVLVIITRNIDLSVGSIVGFTGMVMGILQVNILPQYLGLGHPMIWVITAITGLIVGALIGAFRLPRHSIVYRHPRRLACLAWCCVSDRRRQNHLAG
jgi:D-xylose transport system permease protein